MKMRVMSVMLFGGLGALALQARAQTSAREALDAAVASPESAVSVMDGSANASGAPSVAASGASSAPAPALTASKASSAALYAETPAPPPVTGESGFSRWCGDNGLCDMARLFGGAYYTPAEDLWDSSHPWLGKPAAVVVGAVETALFPAIFVATMAVIAVLVTIG